jgi:hypothetical protein
MNQSLRETKTAGIIDLVSIEAIDARFQVFREETAPVSCPFPVSFPFVSRFHPYRRKTKNERREESA